MTTEVVFGGGGGGAVVTVPFVVHDDDFRGSVSAGATSDAWVTPLSGEVLQLLFSGGDSATGNTTVNVVVNGSSRATLTISDATPTTIVAPSIPVVVAAGDRLALDVATPGAGLSGLRAVWVVGAAGALPFQTFGYTGADQSFTVPAGVVSLTVVLKGGQGGADNSGAAAGGLGAVVSSTVSVTPGETLTVRVAGQGAVGSGTVSAGHTFPGGGAGVLDGGGSGGGYTALLRGSTVLALAAGGGGGGGNGGGGGGASGTAGATSTGPTPGGGGGAGTGSAGGGAGASPTGFPGAAGTALTGADYPGGSLRGGGGGGGGVFGGGSGGGDSTAFGGGGGGGGGSSLGDTVTNGVNSGLGSVAISWTAP